VPVCLCLCMDLRVSVSLLCCESVCAGCILERVFLVVVYVTA